MLLIALLLALVTFLIFSFFARAYLGWVVAAAELMLTWFLGGPSNWLTFGIVGGALAAAAIVFGNASIRQNLVTRGVRRLIAPILPVMSETEKAALDAGTVWWDAELFSGAPDWNRLLRFEPRLLTPKEQAFLDGPCAELCDMIDDWEVQQEGDLPDHVWQKIKDERFLGMIIPEEYGGLGFSARAHSDVIVKLSGRSIAAAVSVMVPNSLGPAELLMHYGTEIQKKYWLPRLAKGEEIPCFALTGPENGSDAAGMRAHGVVCKGRWRDGDEDVLGIRLRWDKRYTTLGPRATLLGLAFELHDPDGLLGDEKELGITLALVPTDIPGIEIGTRHDPLGIAFHNGPSKGRDVFVPIDAIIGGKAMAGKGWRMLMDCLSAGRSISLPSLSTASVASCTRIAGVYASLRKQFGLPIGRFEGVQEKLARIGGMTYQMDAARTLTAGAVDAGEKPSVISAIVKAWCTEGMRVVTNDAMDVLAGAGISRGPRNPLARIYQAVPIGITVEGANILTRTMIVFGQGAMRCHPFAEAEVASVRDPSPAKFDAAFFGHVNFVFTNLSRSLFLSLIGGWAPGDVQAGRDVRRAIGHMNRLSASFAITADVAMATLGADLKRREMLSGRLADVLAWLYMASATVKRFVAEGEPEEDRAAMQWGVDHALYEAEEALRGVIDNLPLRPAAWVLRAVVFPVGGWRRPPRDVTKRAIADALLEQRSLRARLTRSLHTESPDDPGLGRLEDALATVLRASSSEAKLKTAIKEGRVERGDALPTIRAAVEAGVVTEDEAQAMCAAEHARREAARVDAFDDESYRELRG